MRLVIGLGQRLTPQLEPRHVSAQFTLHASGGLLASGHRRGETTLCVVRGVVGMRGVGDYSDWRIGAPDYYVSATAFVPAAALCGCGCCCPLNENARVSLLLQPRHSRARTFSFAHFPSFSFDAGCTAMPPPAYLQLSPKSCEPAELQSGSLHSHLHFVCTALESAGLAHFERSA